jgi:hypothetical protein
MTPTQIDASMDRKRRRQSLWPPQALLCRRYLLWPLLSAVAWLVMLLPGRGDADNVRTLLLVYGQALLPPLIGATAAALLLADPCRELCLTMPRPIWRSLLERLGLLLLSALLSWVGVLLAAGLVNGPAVAAGFFVRAGLASATVILLLAGLGLCASLLFQSALAGGILALGAWAAGLLLRQTLLVLPLGPLFHPCLLLADPANPLWPANSVALALVSLALTALAMGLTGREERLLPSGAVEEEL